MHKMMQEMTLFCPVFLSNHHNDRKTKHFCFNKSRIAEVQKIVSFLRPVPLESHLRANVFLLPWQQNLLSFLLSFLTQV